MKCSACGNELRVVSGGNKTDKDTTEITMVHVWGCLNDKCEKRLIEQARTETVYESFKG